jgi:cytochrome c2
MKLPNSPRPFSRLLPAAALLLLAALPARALDLHRERGSPLDLALTGRLAGVPAGETRYVTWADLRALPSTKLKVDGEFVPGEQEVTVVFLEDLWKQLPRAEGADVLLATCSDGYASVFRADFIAKYRPFLILEINGQGPEKWPPPGLKFNPGPYVMSVSSVVVPGVAQLLDAPHKKPWGVTVVEVANYAERFGGAYAGPWASLSPQAVQGREIWVNSCACCHQGPGGIFAGTKCEQPFPVIQAIAGYNQDFFKKYVRDPKAMMAEAMMEAHPHYTDAQFDRLIAFITADGKK